MQAVRKLDQKGRIVLPPFMLGYLNAKEGDRLFIELTEGTLVVRKCEEGEEISDDY